MSAAGRILAEDMITEMENPPFDRSPIDGYACRAADIRETSAEHPAVLRVTEEIDAGQYSNRTVQFGEAVRIMTGAAIPPGCDCCVRQESTDYGETTVSICESVPVHGNYCDRGEDFRKGVCMLQTGEKLGYVELANLAAMGTDSVLVYETPRIALFTTGDEVMKPGKPLLPGKIYNSNFYLLSARLAEFGITPLWQEHIPDDAGAVAAAIRRAAKEGADLILTTGGVSVGKKDILHETIRLLDAEKLFWKVRLKPGSPTIFSVFRDVPVISLSGNPFGALANMELLVRPALTKMTGDGSYSMQQTSAILHGQFQKASKGRRFIRARYENGAVYLPDGLHSSGVLASMRGCNCLIDIAPGTPALNHGDTVNIWLLSSSDPVITPNAFGARASFPPKTTANTLQKTMVPAPDNSDVIIPPTPDHTEPQEINNDMSQNTVLAAPQNSAMAASQDSTMAALRESDMHAPQDPRIFVISGVKNSGKTTLITRLIPIFREMGWQTATIKHDGHGFDPDVPGTDSYRHRTAGACGTAIYSDELTMVIKRNPDSGTGSDSEARPLSHESVPQKVSHPAAQKVTAPVITEKDLIRAFPEADLILLEGFKWTDYPKIEIVREGNSSAPVCDPDTLVGIASDCADTGNFPADIPVLNLNQPEEIAQAIKSYLTSGKRKK
ncbi:MAG: molybdopterin-guanine dinucleotide biosynthesis protein MobB [Lachnospiraceae bacterium]|nr:molybdopterin-guanine dinucleotide biosynthesis protein MobB [Lachnospiraceae bacterium]